MSVLFSTLPGPIQDYTGQSCQKQSLPKGPVYWGGEYGLKWESGYLGSSTGEYVTLDMSPHF